MSACPTCGKPVDSLRARDVKVRGIHVVAYCSPECLAAAGDSAAVVAPTARTATPAQGVVKQSVAPDSGPVIEIRYEPASGVVTSAKDERTPTPTPKPIVKDEVPAGAEAKKPEADKKVEDKKVDKKIEDKKADKKDDKASRRDRKSSDRRPILKIVEEAGGVPRDIKAPKSAPVPDKVTPKEPEKLSAAKLSSEAQLAPGKRRASRETLDRDNANVDQSEDWLDDEPANVGAIRTSTDAGAPQGRSGAKRAVIVLLVLGVLAASGLLAYKYLYVSKGNAAKVLPNTGSVGLEPGSGSAMLGSRHAETPVDAAPVEAPQVRATAVLRHWLADNSPKIQRLAAAALSRTGDKAAIERLASALQHDKIEEAGRHEVAYALARAGDPRGRDAMTAAISAPRRDDKLSVGRLLVQLGDTRAVNVLAQYLELPQHRLGAAEWLARLGEPRAIKVLEQIRSDPAAGADDKARAVIALAHAGKSGLTDDLHRLLEDTHFNVYAAEILATKRDEAARPVLIKQLDLPSLRVGAARALRALAPDGNHAPELELLLAALDDPNKQRDIEQVSLAEAILLLSGSASWADKP